MSNLPVIVNVINAQFCKSCLICPSKAQQLYWFILLKSWQIVTPKYFNFLPLLLPNPYLIYNQTLHYIV